MNIGRLGKVGCENWYITKVVYEEGIERFNNLETWVLDRHCLR